MAVVVAAAGIAPGCQGAQEVYEPAALAKVAPASVSEPEGWKLFDRSVSSAYAPSGRPITVGFDRGERLYALKVRGPAPYLIELRGDGDRSLGFDPVNASTLAPGWHVFASAAPDTVQQVELRFEAIGAGGGAVPELELWAEDAAPSPARADLTAAELPAGHVADASATAHAAIAPGACATFPVALARPPSQLRHAFVVYESTGLLRTFELARSINGRAPSGGGWLGGDRETRTLGEEVDPASLRAGPNEVRLCLPAAARDPVTIAKLRIIGELDRGTRLVAAATTGGDSQPAPEILDGDPATSRAVAAGERLVLGFERLVAPDALVIGGAAGREPRVACIDKADAETTLATTAATGARALQLDAGARACAALALTFDAATVVTDVDVIGSGAAEPVDWPRLVVTSAPEHFGAAAWVGGFSARPPVMTGAIRVEVAARPSDAMTGDFGRLLERTGDPAAAWTVPIEARFPDGGRHTRQVVLDRDHRAELERARTGTAAAPPGSSPSAPDPRFGDEGAEIVVRATPSQPARVRLGSHIGLDIPAGAVAKPTDIEARHLGATSLPPLDPGMINVTAPNRRGYEFLPHGQRFARPVEVIVPFDPRLIPEGLSADDVHTYYYDPGARRWRKLDRRSIDLGDKLIRSATDHFTIMIDAVLAAPSNPTPLSFDPTALSGIGAASAAANIDLIEPPAASSSGDAHVALPIRLPAGRGAYKPQLGLGYASGGGNGWLGVGWDLTTSRIEIDTRWGVPTYRDGEEPRYLFDGAPLVPTLDEAEGPKCADGSSGRRYHPRVEGSFALIRRCGTNPADYYFEVHDREGTKHIYGDVPNEPGNASLRSYRLRPAPCNPCGTGIFRWSLNRVVDPHGNTTVYKYQLDTIPNAEPSRDVYLQSIEYTSHPTLAALYAVELVLDNGARPDRIVSGRAGFKMTTRHLLRAVRVKMGSQIIREYVLTYAHGQFDKSVLSTIRVYGENGCATSTDAFAAPTCSSAAFLDEHAFTYFRETEGFEPVAAWEMSGDPQPTTAALHKGSSKSYGAGLSTSVGVPPALFTAGVTGSFGERKEVTAFQDVNGDGLVDQLFSVPGGVHVLYNQGSAAQQFSLSGPPVNGLALLGRETSHSWGIDASAGIQVDGWGASVSGGLSNSTSRSGRFFTDLDGDGFVDVLASNTDLLNMSNGKTLMSAPCMTGHCFEVGAFGSTQAINPAADPVLQAQAEEVRSRLVRGAPVAQWVAPYTGRIRITGLAALIQFGTLDGVTVDLYHGDDLLQAWTLIDPNDPAHIDVPDLQIAAGEAIYLRVSTGDDDGIRGATLLDEVKAQLTASYTKTCLDPGCNTSIDPFAAKEPTGEPVFDFDLNETRVHATTLFRAPAAGELRVAGSLRKLKSAANIRVCLQRIESTAPQTDLPCATPNGPTVTTIANVNLLQNIVATIPIGPTFAIGLGDIVVLRAESDYSFDPSAITFAPPPVPMVALSYQAACIPDGSSCTTTTDPEELASLPIDASSFGVFYAAPTPLMPLGTPPLPFVAPHAGQLLVLPFAHPFGGGAITIAMRTDRLGTVQVITCASAVCNQNPNFAITSIIAGESVSFEVLADTLVLPPVNPVVTVTYDGSEPRTVPLIFRKRALTPAPRTPFVGGYRGWHATFWNEHKPFAPRRFLDDYADLDAQTLERQFEIAKSAVTPIPSFGGLPFVIGPVWRGPGSPAFVSVDGHMHAARLGNVGTNDPTGLTSADSGLFAGDYARSSSTFSWYVGAGGQLGSVDVTANLSATVTRSATESSADIVDLNGDGVADVITGGRCIAGSLSATEGPELPGFAMGSWFRRRVGYDYSIGMGATATYPRNTASGRKLTQALGTPSGGLGGGTSVGLGLGRSQTTDDLIDLNGDGLVDRVRRRGSQIAAAYNLGHTLGAWEVIGEVTGAVADSPIDDFQLFEDGFEVFGVGLGNTGDALSHDTTFTQHAKFSLDLFVVSFSYTTRKNSTRVTRQLADLNGDGLPDLLLKRHGDPIRVQYNRGGDFGPSQVWTTPPWEHNSAPLMLSPIFDPKFDQLQATITGADVLGSTGSQSGKTYTGGFNFPVVPGVAVGGSTVSSRDTDTFEVSLMDVTGDGAPDHVFRRGESNDPAMMYVKRNRLTGRSNLLRRIVRPLGGQIDLDYQPAGNTVDMPQQRQVLSRVEVDDGVDLGAAFASPNLVTTFTYAEGRFHRFEKQFLGFAKVTATRADGTKVEQTYDNATLVTSGRLKRETTRDAANQLYRDHVITNEVRNVVDASNTPLVAHPACTNGLHPLLARVGADACLPRLVLVTRDDDIRSENGTVTKVRTVLDTEHDRFGHVLVSRDLGDDAIPGDDVYATATYLNDVDHWFIGQPTLLEVRAGSATGTLLRSRTGDYVNGDLHQLHVTTGSGTATTTLEYNAFGNIRKVTTPPNHAGQSQTYDVTFDAAAAMYPTTIVDGFGYTSTAAYDLRYGIATTETDINGAQIVRTLDAHGRLKTVQGPYDTPSAPALAMDYLPLAPRPHAITTTRASAPPGYTGPVPPPMTSVAFLDGLGRAIEVRKTAVVDGVAGMTTAGIAKYDSVGRTVTTYHPFFTAGASTAFVAPLPTLATHTTYDALDRARTVTHPDAAVETTSYEIATAPGGALLFRTQILDAKLHARESFADHLGRVRAYVEHPLATTASVTRYDYRPTGELAAIVDAELNTTTLGYDRRGLMTSMEGGDTGLIEHRYDLMGNRIATIEPNHRALAVEVAYRFDRNRLATIDYPSKPDVTFQYGPPGAPLGRAGRLVRVTDESGSQEHSYGALGEIRQTIRTVAPSTPGGDPIVFGLKLTTDSLGRQLQIQYPDGETVTNTYDAAGMLAEVHGAGDNWTKPYADQIRYDIFGNRTRLRSGNNVVSTWSFEPKRVRLDTATTTLPTSKKVRDIKYAYDAVGNPESITNNVAPLPGPSGALPGPSSLTLTYDGVDRLKTAQGSVSLEPGKSSTYTQTFSYTPSHNLELKSRAHKLIDNGTTETQAATSFSSTYAYTGGRPHLPSSVGTLQITYDPSGNPRTRIDPANGTQQTLTWDDDNRLVDLTSPGVHQHNTYDAGGLRVRRKSGTQETIFSSQYFDLENNQTAIKHVFAGPTRIASALGSFDLANNGNPAPLDVPAIAYFFHSDHLGSTSVLTAEDGTVHQSLEYFVDGETWLDRAPTTPVNGYLFSGKPLDRDTGLYDFGQRFYDPRTSLWLGLDPDVTDSPSGVIRKPVALSHGAYAGNSPVRNVDRNGRSFHDFIVDEVASRAYGVVQVAEGVAIAAAGSKMCLVPGGCLVGTTMVALGADLAAAGITQVITGDWERTAVGALFGREAQDVQMLLAGAGGMFAVYRSLRAARTMGEVYSIWKLPPARRGEVIEKILGHNTPSGFAVDRWKDGVATSIKSLDTTSKTYKSSVALHSKVMSYIEQIAAFKGETRAGLEVAASAIKQRELILAVPYNGVKTWQRGFLEGLAEEARKRKVKLIVLEM